MRLIYHPDAEQELIDAAQSYSRSVLGLGSEFLVAVGEAIAIILDAPQRWRVLEGDVRRYIMRRFPYAVYYRALEDEIRVLAFKKNLRG